VAVSVAIVKYAGWLLVCLGAMELLTHAAPAMAVAASGAYSEFTPLQLMMFCFVLLKLMWLKFLVIWRFFRLWALLDGVETPVCNHASHFVHF
jgi:protein-cysteine N-palmitoyltransferase HHAT